MALTFSEIAAEFGCAVKNVRWSWCSVAPDRRWIILTLSHDHFDRGLDDLRYPFDLSARARRRHSPNEPRWTEIAGAAALYVDDPTVEVLGVICGA